VLVKSILPLTFFIVSTSLFAKTQTCYSIGIITVKKENAKTLKDRLKYPQENCITFNINNFTTLRCECVDSKKDAKKLLEERYAKYKDAYVVTTKKERFKVLDTNATKKVVIAKKNIVKPKDLNKTKTVEKIENNTTTIVESNISKNNKNSDRDFVKEFKLLDKYKKYFNQQKIKDDIIRPKKALSGIFLNSIEQAKKDSLANKNKTQEHYDSEINFDMNLSLIKESKHKVIFIKDSDYTEDIDKPIVVELEDSVKKDTIEHLGLEDLNGYIYTQAEDKYENVSLINFNQYDLDSFFDLEYMIESDSSYDGNSMSVLKELNRQNFQKELTALKNKNSFYGIYVGIDAGKNFKESNHIYKKNSDWQYSLSAKVELLQGGYFEDQKVKEEEILESKIEYLTRLSKLLQRNFEEELFEVELMKNEIEYIYANIVEKLYDKLLRNSDIYLKDGITTISDIEYLQEQLENVRIIKEIHLKQDRKKIDNVLFEFLNEIQIIELIQKDKFKKIVNKNNPTLKLLDTNIEKLSYKKRYIDDVELNLYSKYTKEDSIGWYSTVGIGVNMPLSFVSNNEVNKIKQNAYSIEKSSIKSNLEQKVDYYYNKFIYTQKRIFILQNELNYIYEKYAQMSNSNSDVDRLTALMKIDVEKKKRDIMFQRLETYRVLLELYRLANTTNINEFIVK